MFSADARSFRQQSRLAIALSWVGGFTNVFAFLTLKAFVSHVTGASTMFGLHTARASMLDVALFGDIVGFFFLGAVCSALMTELAKRRGFESKYLPPLALETVFLVAIVLLLRQTKNPAAGPMRYLLCALAAYAMGLQNATITKISGAIVRSTHLTGVVTDLGIEFVQYALWAWDQLRGRIWRRAGRVLRISQRHPTLLRVVLLASIWMSFVFGAVIGALAVARFREMALCGPIAFLLVLIVVQWKTPAADIRELDLLADPELKLHGIVHSLLPAELGLYRVAHNQHPRLRAPNISDWIDRVSQRKRIVILVFSPVAGFDATALMDLDVALTKLEESGRRLIIAGVNPAQYKKLARERLIERIGPENVCPDIEFAIARGTDLVREFRQEKQPRAPIPAQEPV